MNSQTNVDRGSGACDGSQVLPILNCDDCGACCMSMCSPPFLGPDDPERLALPAAVRHEYEQGMRQRDRDGWPDDVPCFWFDPQTKRCRNYEHRPSVCRDFDIGSEGCRSWRDEYNVDVERINRASVS